MIINFNYHTTANYPSMSQLGVCSASIPAISQILQKVVSFVLSIKIKDVLIADRDKWSNDPSIYNPHEAPTLLSLMLLKEISE